MANRALTAVRFSRTPISTFACSAKRLLGAPEGFGGGGGQVDELDRWTPSSPVDQPAAGVDLARSNPRLGNVERFEQADGITSVIPVESPSGGFESFPAIVRDRGIVGTSRTFSQRPTRPCGLLKLQSLVVLVHGGEKEFAQSSVARGNRNLRSRADQRKRCPTSPSHAAECAR